MNKKWITSGILLLLAALFIYHFFEQKRKPHIDATDVQTLPSLPFFQMDGDSFNNQSLQGRSVILVYFSPDCIHCQGEARSLEKHLAGFHQATILMISRATKDEMNTFAKNYHLAGQPNVVFLQDKNNAFQRIFHSGFYPTIFVYDKDHHFKKVYPGETDFRKILSVLN